MKKAITIRLDPELLARARECARTENRTLTNYLETTLKRRIESRGHLPQEDTRRAAIHSKKSA